IGRAEDNGGTVYYANGLIDDVRLWNDNILVADILAQANTELVGDESGLVGYWKFNEQKGVEALDTTAVANSGLIYNALYVPRVTIYQFDQPPVITPESHQDWRVQMSLMELPQ